MANLDKLIDLLEQIKQTDPSFKDKAEKALDALVSEEEKTSIEDRAPAPPPPPKEPPDRVELTDHHWGDVRKGRELIVQAITKFGLLQQNYEADKEALMENIDQLQDSLRKYIDSLHDIYNLDSPLNYNLVFPKSDKEKATFVRKKL